MPPVARFEGEGQVVAVCDTGFDHGSTSNVHPVFPEWEARAWPLPWWQAVRR
jgi:hypothetical protein